MAELNPALLLIRIGGESGEPGVLDGPTHREMVEVLVGEVLEAKDTMHGVVEVTPDTSAPNPGSFGDVLVTRDLPGGLLGLSFNEAVQLQVRRTFGGSLPLSHLGERCPKSACL